MLIISPSIIIDDSELQERFVRSSGPGGQNVNKVSTAVELRFDIKNSACLPEPLRERLLARRDRRLTTKPSKGAKERRLTGKRERADIKRTRSSKTWD